MHIIKKYKEHSHIPIEKIKELQCKHRVDLIQPRDRNGEVNPEFVKHYGTKALNINRHDVETMAKKSQSLAKVIDKKRYEM